MTNNKDTLCTYAFNSPNIDFSNNRLRMCCHAPGDDVTEADIKFYGIKLFSQFPPLVQTKKDLLSGVRSPACNYCWKIEDSGGKSPREPRHAFSTYMAKTNWFNTHDNSVINEKLDNLSNDEIEMLARFLDEPRLLEIALSNTCDLKCMYCSHMYSTQWEAELTKYKEFPIINKTHKDSLSEKYQSVFWEYFLRDGFRKVEYISFIGGEPLIINKFYIDLETILGLYESHDNQSELPPQISINIITNFNCQEKYFNKLMELIPRICRNKRLLLRIGISIESIDTRAEFIRTGTDWIRLDRNINKLFSSVQSYNDRIELGFHTALNSLCISDLPNFIKYVVNLREMYNIHISLFHNQVVFPEWLNPSILPPSYSEYVDAAIAVLKTHITDEINIPGYNKWGHYIAFLEGLSLAIKTSIKAPEVLQRFVSELDKLTSRRGLDFNGTFPEMVPFYNDIKEQYV